MEIQRNMPENSEINGNPNIDSSDSVDVLGIPILSTIPYNNSSNTTGGLAKEERIGRDHYICTVKAEQRARFLSRLGGMGVGTNRIEFNQIKSRNELVRDSGRKVKDIVQEMELKAKDATKDASQKRWRRDKGTNGQMDEGHTFTKFLGTFILKGLLHLSFLIQCYHFTKILLQFIKLL